MGTESPSSTEQKPIFHTERKEIMKMKAQMTNVKRILSTLLLLLLAAAMITSCTKQPPKIEQPDEELIWEVQDDFNRWFSGDGYNPESESNFAACSYYGTYNGCALVTLASTGKGISDTPEGWSQEVAGVAFYYPPFRATIVWKEGAIYSIKEAYEQNLLTKEQIQTIADIHNNDRGLKIN